MSLLELFDLTKNLHEVAKSPESSKPLSTASIWTIVVGIAGFFVLFGSLFIHDHNC